MTSSFNELRVVLVGKTGNGKSATGNSLLNGRVGFKAALSASSVTKDCSAQINHITDINGTNKKLVVVDTPGFFDTNTSNTNEMVKKTITKQIFELTSPGVHAFLFILSNGRFTPEEKQTVDFIETIFGTVVTQYGIVILTHLDELEEDEEYRGLDAFIQNGSSDLQALIRKCGGRKFAVNNKLRDKKLQTQTKELVKMIDDFVRINNGRYYTNAEYERIEKQRWAACGGHRCPECGKCRDWYYAGSQTDWNWILRMDHWTQSDLDRWHGGVYDKYFKSRDEKTCKHDCVYDGGNTYDGFRGQGNIFDFVHDLRLVFEERPCVSRARRLVHGDICECANNYKR